MKRAVVVGSGAGGATVARELATTFETTVLEAGPEFQRFAGGLGRVERLRSSRLFLDPRMIRLMFPAMHVTMAAEGMALVYGMATGGTTTLATGNALRCDEALLARGIDLGPEFDRLSADLPLSTSHQASWRPVTRRLFLACDALGLGPTGHAQAGGLREVHPLRPLCPWLPDRSEVGQPRLPATGRRGRSPPSDQGEGGERRHGRDGRRTPGDGGRRAARPADRVLAR